MNRYKLLSWSAFVFSSILLVLPRIIPICDGLKNGHPMDCHYTYQAEFIVALLALITSAALLVLRTAEARVFAGFITALLGSSMLVMPQSWAIGICANGSCQETTFYVNIFAGLLAATGAGLVWICQNARPVDHRGQTGIGL